MTLEQFVKNNKIPIPLGHKWLVWDAGRWYVFERPYRKKNMITLLETEDISEAIRVLIAVK